MPAESLDLLRLVEERRIDEVLRIVGPDGVAEAWMRRHRTHDEADWWAVELWMEPAWWEDEARVRDGLLRLVALANEDGDFGMIGAGPMEDFIVDDPTRDLVDERTSRVRWIEQQASTSDGFRRALANVWVFGEVPDADALRIERAAGVRLARPRG